MIKKIVIIGVLGVFALIVTLGIIALKSGKFSLGDVFFAGKREPVIKGDLTIPITATGTVEADRLIQIKSKAGGIVQELPVSEGQSVKAGDKLIVLDPVDEKRNVEATQSAVDRTKSLWEKAKIALENQQRDLPLQTKLAEVRQADAVARIVEPELRVNRLRDLLRRESQNGRDVKAVSDQEMAMAEAALISVQASRDMATVDLERAKNNEVILVRSAQEDVQQSEAAYNEAVKQLEEAQQRLKETTVIASQDAMVYAIHVKKSEAIQSGTQSFTGGTVLMTLADVSSMFVIAQVDEADIGAIRKIAPKHARPGQTERFDEEVYIEQAHKAIEASEKGEQLTPEALEMLGRPVEVTVDAYRNETYKGVIERILPEPQRVNNAVAFRVRIRLVGDDLTKLMGLQADLSFTTETKKGVLLVKNDALTSEGRKCFVYVPFRESESDKWGEKKIEVSIGSTDGTNTEIVSGLKEGEEVWIKRPVDMDKR